MRYSNVVLASAFAFSGVAFAGDETATSNVETDYKVECIETAIADEVPQDQREAFVAKCVQDKLAAAKKLRNPKS